MRKNLWVAGVNLWVSVCKSLYVIPHFSCDKNHLGITTLFTHSIHNSQTQAYPQHLSIFQSVNTTLYTLSTQLNKWSYRS